MSDKLTPIHIRTLFNWIVEEYKSNNSMLGIHRDQFFISRETDSFKMVRYGYDLDAPLGVAAGPHSQLSQNIIASWLCGARYIELKTIQTLDELEVSKPCIDMEDEGYNCEWSQELKLRQSYDEYLNAWIMIHVLKSYLGWDHNKDLGTIFNMSAGYNMDGILNKNVQAFLDLMENCSEDLHKKLDQLDGLFPVHELNIPSRISDNLTLSTMHGCPPDEIEKIARYFLEERYYHTAVKLNPTLLGPDKLRNILNNLTGFENVIVPDEAFEHDLKYDESLILINNLQKSASQAGVEFGLKLTNTLEVKNTKTIFPSTENMSYLSGRALHPISINVAALLQNHFNGCLDVSFSAGVDAFNFADVISCNIRPVTTCTDILKPGGYTRLKQYLNNLSKSMEIVDAKTIEEFVQYGNTAGNDTRESGLKNLVEYADKVVNDPLYQSRHDNYNNIKTPRKLTDFDCVSAPCIENCSTDQNIPMYMYHTARSEYDLAYEAIRANNPLPGITGYVCDHLCELKCTRQNLDNPLLIREIKRFVTEKAATDYKVRNIAPTGKRVAVIGAGPSGLSCAWFLALAGIEVIIFESKNEAGGMVTSGIPVFRLDNQTIKLDIETIKSAGITIKYNTKIEAQKFKNIRSEFDAVYLASGAQLNKKLGIIGENVSGVIEPLDFLARVKSGEKIHLGNRIAVIGGGNTALDAARTSWRLCENGGEVTILYRRTKNEMPADYIEVEDAIEEGISIQQLTAPEKITKNNESLVLTCSKMQLGDKDASGRARPIKLDGSEFDLEFDTIIPAIGQDVEYDFIKKSDIDIPVAFSATALKGVFAGGDLIRGASSVINAIGDGQHSANKILDYLKIKINLQYIGMDKNLKPEHYQNLLADRKFGQKIHDFVNLDKIDFELISKTMTEDEARLEASRCLFCDDECNICVSVCPNRANQTYRIDPKAYNTWQISGEGDNHKIEESSPIVFSQEPQIFNIVDACNECGDCTTFCPTAGQPFMDKPRFCLSLDVFENEDNAWYLDGPQIKYRNDDNLETLIIKSNQMVFTSNHLKISLSSKDFSVIDAEMPNDLSFNTSQIIKMWVLYENLKDNSLFKK
ncbi:MAG: putative selenate reductase subunit YgfK [Candidatus Marinimicrobia bacterium]|nr:putative selenate reductase subunit YgfK [Candidatus Neomarinimicrobiota bacterium]MBT3633745.1 putative selenate reductase subunit YgfK [Candidatus Neomarinimicrobiota bacterium]MBT3682537.1 putative selenate reductase subunit YgfK [Candidatus Neomarinimicrobiota bacterium]MBT3759301.1 putative selenate reductase subunit YgfK [Candidatus Neomarinimicrobiota bacterium]MBT3894691.1 putative selenate reductase subunit YgfK [Candidatus Neomarinimicrobiota bacterium]